MTAHLEVLAKADDCLDGNRHWRKALLVDVGSTFTKMLVIARDGSILGRAEAPTTIDHDVMGGVRDAVASLPEQAQGPYDWALASSSAAGGLRMASVGLTASLSGKAGALAALGAGAKVIGSEHGFLDDEGVARIEAMRPHLVLLSGGIDGGNAHALLHNAGMLAKLEAPHGYVIAGNSDVAPDAAGVLESGGRDVRVVANVFPRPGEIAIGDTREAVRDLFERHITRAKGLEQLMARLRAQCEPTPLAVSRALGHVDSAGAPVVIVDLGGATTDVHSLGGLREERRSAELPMPETMRTVEGDLGMRWGAPGIVAAMSEAQRREVESRLGCDLAAAAHSRHADPGFLPDSDQEQAIDRALNEAAVAIAIERHAGRVVVRHRPWGDRYQVTGKDLRSCRLLVATGGAFRHDADPERTIRCALSNCEAVQAPRDPRIALDRRYALYAIGLIARLDPALARKLSSQALMPAEPDRIVNRPAKEGKEGDV